MLQKCLIKQRNQNINVDKFETSQDQSNKAAEQKINQRKFIKLSSISQRSEDTIKQRIRQKFLSLNAQQEVQSLDQNISLHSQQMDIDEQNDIVNQLSFIETLGSQEDEDQIFADLSIKQRIIYANSKKHQGNQFFRQNNLEEAIQSYKVGLSLLKPQSFSQARTVECLSLVELTSNILFNMGTCYFILMSFRQAIKFYDQAIIIKPNYTKAIHNRALCHFEEQNILSAYNDIKNAYNLDKANPIILSDLKRIQNQYQKRYKHSSQKKRILKNDNLQQKKNLSKSMMDTKQIAVKHFHNIQTTTNSLIYSGEPLQIKQKLLDKNKQTKQKQQKKQLQPKRQKIKSFYSKRFFPLSSKYKQKPQKQIKQTSKSNMNSPKFRPFLNKNPSSLRFQQNKIQNLQLEKSAGQIFERQKRINNFHKKLQLKIINVQKEDKQAQKSFKTELKKSIQKYEQKRQDRYWGYLPFIVATGLGLYHGLKAIIDK